MNASNASRRRPGPGDCVHLGGGCRHCKAHKTYRRLADGRWRLTVLHEPQCPTRYAFTRTFGAVDQAVLPGGCPRCTARQLLSPQPNGAYLIDVHHEDWCTALTALDNRKDAS